MSEKSQGCFCIISIADPLFFWPDDLQDVNSLGIAHADDQFSNNSFELRVLCVSYLVVWLDALCTGEVVANIPDLD